MLDLREIKLVIAALSSHRANLLKTIEKPDIDAKKKELSVNSVKQLDVLMKKLAVKVPAKKAPPAAPPPPPNTNTAASPKPTKRNIALPTAHILIAEDNPDSATLLKSIIEDIGIKHVDIAKDGREAVSALEKCSPAYDLVILDWDMPELTGIQVRQAVRSLAKLRDTHFIMVTAISEASRIKQAIQAGIHDYIVKPVDADVIEKKIKMLFNHEE